MARAYRKRADQSGAANRLGGDFIAYDPALRRIYTANGRSGTMTIIRQDAADTYSVLENVPTQGQ